MFPEARFIKNSSSTPQLRHEDISPCSRQQGRSKEGFSVFGLFDQTKSGPGRRCLKEWMLKPLHDIAAISARQVRGGLPTIAEEARRDRGR